MQVSVLVDVSDRSGDRDGSCRWGTGHRLHRHRRRASWYVVDPCVVGDGRLCRLPLGSRRAARHAGTVCLSAQAVNRGGSGDLGSAVG